MIVENSIVKAIVRKWKSIPTVGKVIVTVASISIIGIASVIISSPDKELTVEDVVKVVEEDKSHANAWSSIDVKDKESYPVTFDFTHNAIGYHAITSSIPDGENFVVLATSSLDPKSIAFDAYVEVSSPDDTYPPIGSGIAIQALTEKQAESLASWVEITSPDAVEELPGGNAVIYFILDGEEYDFQTKKLIGADVTFDWTDSGKTYGELIGTTVEPFSSVTSWAKAYVTTRGIPAGWIQAGRDAGKSWLSRTVPDEALGRFGRFNVQETIWVPAEGWKDDGSTPDVSNGDNFVKVTVNGDATFTAWGIIFETAEDVSEALTSNGFSSFEDGIAFTEKYNASISGIEDDFRAEIVGGGVVE